MVERLGAKTVILEHSLSSLNAIQEQIERMRSGNQASFSGLVGIGIDYRTNQLALDVQSGHRSVTAHALAAMSIDSNYYRVNELSEIPQLSSYIVGAECFENPLFTSWQNGDPYWCSIGFSVQGGFITAGHCGAVNHDVESCIGTTPMGQFKGSTWHSVPQGQRIQDSGWVETNPSWQPLALVNGYAGGMFSVTGEFGGYREVPVGSSVCRYGQASGNIPGAPHCGVVQVRNKTQQFCGGLNAWGGCAFYEHIQNTTETNICVEFGDSGGAFLSGTGHAQGTTIGGHNGTCPSASKAWFQPAGQTLNAFSRTLLTSHGSNPPTIANLNCPDPGNSGNGQYVCQIIYNTQGSTAVSWTSSTGHSSNSDMLFGTCIPNTTVNVDVSVTNNWGITPQSTNFPCPTGSIQ